MKIFLILVFLTITGTITAQTKKLSEYVDIYQLNIDTFQSINNLNLVSLDDAIKNVDVIFLGEPGHYEGNAFSIKSKLIKYLHEKHGFNVLAFECDFFALCQGWKNLDKQNQDSIRNFIQNNLFAMWAGADQNKDLLYDYIPKQSSIQIMGIDPAFSGHYTLKTIINFLNEGFLANGLDIHSQAYSIFIQNLTWLHQNKYQDKNSNKTVENITAAQSRYNEIALYTEQVLPKIKDKTSFLYQLLLNIKSNGLGYSSRYIDSRKTINLRDEQMASNIEWIYKNKNNKDKIIVWAANYHITKQPPNRSAKNMKTMVEHLRENGLIKNSYSIGMTCGSGRFTYDGHTFKNMKQKTLNNIEFYFNPTYAFAFLDFSKLPTRNQLFANFSSYEPTESNWNSVYDGMIYIRSAKPATYFYLRNVMKR